MEHVLYNGVKSPVRTVLFGVPQGHVLGPLLFLLHTADLEIRDVKLEFFSKSKLESKKSIKT